MWQATSGEHLSCMCAILSYMVCTWSVHTVAGKFYVAFAAVLHTWQLFRGSAVLAGSGADSGA